MKKTIPYLFALLVSFWSLSLSAQLTFQSKITKAYLYCLNLTFQLITNQPHGLKLMQKINAATQNMGTLTPPQDSNKGTKIDGDATCSNCDFTAIIHNNFK